MILIVLYRGHSNIPEVDPPKPNPFLFPVFEQKWVELKSI
ncbi:hypothetical protein D1BOALGB6SA_1449 [Olavius sp. associated proteobacterium Delta 1]|nr:hypothetical protein D1BOALGB6SA_1449 [Olavius sp. associated proteobacterium Delta 1]